MPRRLAAALALLGATLLALMIALAPAGAAGDDLYPHLGAGVGGAPLMAERTIFGFAVRAARGPAVSLAGVVAPLAVKAREIVSACGAKVISALRRSRVRGSGRLSLHAAGRAVDLAGNPGCIYRHLAAWPGGVSTDYGRVRPHHVHVSYNPGGAEWGARFAHWKPGKAKQRRHARRHHRVAAVR